MLDFRSLIRTVAILAMFLLAPALHAQEGLSDAFTSVSSSCDFSNRLLGSSVVAADFNRDSHPDGAVLFRNRNSVRIEVHLRFQRISQITFAFTVTVPLLFQALLYALILGFVGGLLPSWRAARLPITTGLREL